jgi:hypothetical protein
VRLLQVHPDSIGAAGISALACAASSATLESVVLGPACPAAGQYQAHARMALTDALPLLRAQMPRLRELRLPVLRVPEEELRALAQQLGRPLAVLRAQMALREADG